MPVWDCPKTDKTELQKYIFYWLYESDETLIFGIKLIIKQRNGIVGN
jgi:hypothetical protein